MSAWRLPSGGTAIDRSRPLRFSFEGRPYQAFEGDTLASALLGAGVDTVARSFKYHRPRGIRAGGWDDPNAFVRLDAPVSEANVLATRLPLVEGLAASAQHCWPSLAFDLGAWAGRLSAFLPAGFYYKTFKWPQRAWPFYEHLIRRAAGLGRLPDPGAQVQSSRQHHRAEVLIIGAGLAGAAAALAVVRSRRSLVWVDDGDAPGGRLLDEPGGASLIGDQLPLEVGAREGESARDWLSRTVAEIDACPQAIRLSRSMAFGLYEHGEVLVLERQGVLEERLWCLQVDRVVLASGACELPLLFENNDRPGVMLAGAVLHYLERYGVACGRRAVLVGPGAAMSGLADSLGAAEVEVVNVVDNTRVSQPREAVSRQGDSQPEWIRDLRVARVLGRSKLESVELHGTDSGPAGRTRIVECDLLAVHGGWSPALQLLAHAPGTTAADGATDWVRPAGMAAGYLTAEQCMKNGWQVALGLIAVMGGASGKTGLKPPQGDASAARHASPAFGPVQSPAIESAAARRTFVDLASDVTVFDIGLAVREGYESPDLLKRYTTLGMGPDQGRSAGPLGASLLAHLRGLPPGSFAATRARPPLVPVAFGTIAGHQPGPLIRPWRETPITAWHRQAGAVMYESGANWRRPGYYPQPGESMHEAIARECRAVREAVGVYDSTPLGKFEISGSDAEAFLERLLPSRIAALAPGRGRYALLLREDGRLLDDGVIVRLSQDRFWLTSTAGHADAVEAWLEYARQWLFRELGRVVVANVSSQWAAIVVCGLRSRELIEKIGTDIALARDDFPFMAVRTGRVAGVSARVFRVSFTGELSYELNVRPRDARFLWLRVIEAGRALGIEPVGSEANHVLRVEKGFISIGHEADGIANPDDLGLGWAIHLDKGDFVGRRSIARDRAGASARPQLVGLEVDDGPPLEEGAQIVAEQLRLGSGEAPRSLGFVTASVASPTLGRPIALALLENGRARIGETVQVTVAVPGGPERGHAGLRLRWARVVAPVFVDPEGVRLRG